VSTAPTTERNASGRANRVAPDGSVHDVAARGTTWGNRGRLLDADGVMVRHSSGRNWLCCRLEFHGRRRTQWQPGRLTELYFLDEATALAAGHRPCGECRYADYHAFKAAWRRSRPDDTSATAIDRHLHSERLTAPRQHRVHSEPLGDLPDGAMFRHDDGFWLVHGPLVLAWSFDGYGEARPRTSMPPVVAVCTPESSVAALRAGYVPVPHPTVADPR
jgi:hypothetical protein